MTAANDGGMGDSADFLFSPSAGGLIVSAAHVRKIWQALLRIDPAREHDAGRALRRLGCVGISLWHAWRNRDPERPVAEEDSTRKWAAVEPDPNGLNAIFALACPVRVEPFDHSEAWYALSNYEEVALVGVAHCPPLLPPVGSIAAALLYLLVDRGEVYPRELGLDRDIPQFSAATTLLDEMRWCVHYTDFRDNHENFATFYESHDDKTAVEAREKLMLSAEFENWLDSQVVRLIQGEI